jgi:hypothetical protein
VQILSGVAYLIGDFLGDQLLCWCLLIVNWAVQLAIIVRCVLRLATGSLLWRPLAHFHARGCSARTAPTLKYWPQLYAMAQLSLYVYILRYPFGYTYVATLAAVALMLYMFVAFVHRHVFPCLVQARCCAHALNPYARSCFPAQVRDSGAAARARECADAARHAGGPCRPCH